MGYLKPQCFTSIQTYQAMLKSTYVVNFALFLFPRFRVSSCPAMSMGIQLLLIAWPVDVNRGNV
jgi:hypothetical protein